MARNAESINFNIFKEHVLDAISAIRKGNKRPVNNTIYNFIKKNQSTNTDYTSIKDVVDLIVKK